MKKIALITGASQGIGRSLSIHLANKGYVVYATMPDPEQWQHEPHTSLHIRFLDVTETHSIETVISEIIQIEGRLDILINNAGVAIFGCAETVSIEQAKSIFDVNFFGVLRMIQAVLPMMRKQKDGLIVNLSSVNGIRPSPGYDIYSSSKFALEGLSEALAATLSMWNIKVIVLQPGPVTTGFTEAAVEGSRCCSDDEPYQRLLEKCKHRLKKRRAIGQSPEEIAEILEEILELKHPSFRYQTSSASREIAELKFVDPTGDQMIKKQRNTVENLLNEQV